MIPRTLRRRIAHLLVSAGLLACVLGPATAQAQVGWHAPAQVTCYDSGRILLEPRYDKVGSFDQYVGHQFHIYSYATGRWQTIGGWHWYHVPAGHAFFSTAVKPDFWNIAPGKYLVYTSYAWWAGGRVIGQAGDYTTAYGFAQGDGVVLTPDRCYTYPAFTAQGSVNSDWCADFGICTRVGARRSHGKRLPPRPPRRVPRTAPAHR